MEKAVLLALAASFCTATASVCQRLGASSYAAAGFDAWLVFRLARRPAWLLGLASMICGFAFQISALRSGPLALVQPVLALELLFVFGYMTVIGQRGRVRRRDWLAAVVAAELYGGSVRKDPALARDLLHATTRLGPARGYYYQLIAGIGWTSLPLLPKLRPPTLILAGDDDPIIPLVNARIMHGLIPRSQLHIYHGGHLELALSRRSP